MPLRPEWVVAAPITLSPGCDAMTWNSAERRAGELPMDGSVSRTMAT